MSFGRSPQRVFVERIDGQIVRIFRRYPYAYTGVGEVAEYPRRDAIEAIRRAVYQRSEQECRDCGKPITWGSMHMHEVLPRGEGGEYSLENSIAICYDCHVGRKDSAHGNRLPRFGEKT